MRRVVLALAIITTPMMATVGDVTKTLHKHQNYFWYSNNFGASAKDMFPILEPELQPDENYHVGLAKDDVDMLLGGRVRQEGFLFDRALTLRDDYNDVIGFTRSKINLDMRTQYGRRTYGGVPAAQMHARLTAFSVWDDENRYTPVLENEVYYNASNHVKKAEIGKHDHRGVMPLFYLDEGWVSVNFDVFTDTLNTKTSLKAGAFPFIVGRGISLGDYPFTGVEFLGWQRDGDIGNATFRPVGILLHKDLDAQGKSAVELYFSKDKKRSHGPDWTREEIRANRLDTVGSNDPKDIQRGTGNDRDILALRGYWCGELGADKKHQVYIEPYAVYVNAPELKVEFDGDASARLLTIGGMSEWSFGNWTVNAEIAGQVGHHQMHAIDRNHLVVDDSYYTETSTYIDGVDPQDSTTATRLDETIGIPAKFQSHIHLGVREFANNGPETSEYLPYRAYYVSDETQHINDPINRNVDAQGAMIRAAHDSKAGLTAGTPYYSKKFESVDIDQDSQYGACRFKTGIEYYDRKFDLLGTKADGLLFNANIPFGGQRRFRPAYKLNCQSVMAMLDACYTLPSKRAKFGLAGGYVQGDAYPFNSELDKDYNGFVPMRDANYVGRYVTSFVMLYPRKLPRPTEMADTNLYAHKNYQTMQNLKYVGASAAWHPMQNNTSVTLEVNGLYFWQVAPPHKWDSYATRTFENSQVDVDNDGGGKEDKIYKYIQEEELRFSGAATSVLASQQLGGELNAVAKWQPFSNCEFVCRVGAFFPGQLYTDIQGTPNVNTRRVDRNGQQHHDALGVKTVFGGMVRMTYKF